MISNVIVFAFERLFLHDSCLFEPSGASLVPHSFACMIDSPFDAIIPALYAMHFVTPMLMPHVCNTNPFRSIEQPV